VTNSRFILKNYLTSKKIRHLILFFFAVFALTVGGLYLWQRMATAPGNSPSPLPLKGVIDVRGEVIGDSSELPIAEARITLFTPNLTYFKETRSDGNGEFNFTEVPGKTTYRFGVAARSFAYEEIEIVARSKSIDQLFSLGAESELGRWTTITDTADELLGGTGSGTLMTNGEILYCHNTKDAIIVDSVAATNRLSGQSERKEGGHAVTLLSNGKIFFAGGAFPGGNPEFDEIVKTAKTYDRVSDEWTALADMNVARWYPGLVRLPDERLLIMAGEKEDPGFERTNTSEIYDPVLDTWTMTGSFRLPTEMPPTVLLYTGEVLKTWREPEIYNIATGAWRMAGQFVQTASRQGIYRSEHPDHSIILLPDGRVMALGLDEEHGKESEDPRMIEFYDPATNRWSLGDNPRGIVIGRPESVILPNGNVLKFGGEYRGHDSRIETRFAGTYPFPLVNIADMYDPTTNTWREVADMNRFIHTHNVSVLAPDGRVIATGGAGEGHAFGDDNDVEAFEPPYLFRGVRPSIDSISSTDLAIGGTFSMEVSRTNAVTDVVLVGTRAVSHWMDGGTQRFLSLDFTQTGSSVEAKVPNDRVRALPGYYIVFVMVDDIPSEGKIVRILPN